MDEDEKKNPEGTIEGNLPEEEFGEDPMDMHDDLGEFDDLDDDLSDLGDPADEELYDAEFDDLGDDDFSVEGDDDWDGGSDDSFSKPPKKKMSFNAMVITGAVVVGFGVLLMQVMNAPQTSSPVEGIRTALNMTGAVNNPVLENPAVTGTPKPVAGAPAVTDSAEEPAQPVQGFLDNPELLNEPKPDNVPRVIDDAPPMPAPITTELMDEQEPESVTETVSTELPVLTEDPVLTPLPEAPAEEVVADISEPVLTPAPLASADITETPVVEMQPEPDMNIAEVLEPETPVLEPSITESVPDLFDTPLTEELPAAPVSITEDITSAPMPEMAEMAKPDMALPVVSDQALENVSGQLAMLTDKIDGMSQRLSTVEGRISDVDRSNKASIAKVTGAIESLEKKVSAMPAKAAAPRASAPAPKVAAAAPKKPPVPKVRWKLRSAQPGKAWVSKAGEKAITMVKEGDSLPGIGRITAISYSDGAWSVRGSDGQIQQ